MLALVDPVQINVLLDTPILKPSIREALVLGSGVLKSDENDGF